MTLLPFGRAVDLVTQKADGGEEFKIGLEAISPHTGKLVAEPVTDYDGDGVAFTDGDVLFGKLRPYLAKAWLADTAGAAVGDFHVYRPVKHRCVARYIAWVVLSESFLSPVISSVYGAKMPRASWDFVRSIPIWVPALTVQEAIADYLDRETAEIDELVQEQQRLINLLRERRAAVIAHGVTHGTRRGDTTGWGRGRLKWDATLVPGGTPPTSEDSYWLDGDDPAGVPFVAIADMSKRGSVVDTSKSLSKAGMSSRGMPLGGPGTLLLAMYASVGEVAFLEIEGTWNQALLGISPNSTVDRRFLAYVLASKRQELLRDVRSNTQDNLNARQIGDVWFLKPPIHVQRDIVDYLDEQTAKIDALIAEAERFIELAQERRSALITAAVTGQIDIPGAADG